MRRLWSKIAGASLVACVLGAIAWAKEEMPAPAIPGSGTPPVISGTVTVTGQILNGYAYDQPALASKPFVTNGLHVTVVLGKAAFAVDDPLTFRVQFKNVSDKGFLLFQSAYFWCWKIQFYDERAGAPWQVMPWQLVPTFTEQGNAVKTLKPGEVLEVPMTLDPAAAKYRYVWAGPPRNGMDPLIQLKPGTYPLLIALELQEFMGQREWILPFWAGKITTEAVAVKIVEKRAATVP